MKSKKAWLMLVGHLFVLLSMAILLYGGVGYRNAGPTIQDVKYVTEMTASVNGTEPQAVSLPYSFKNLDGRTPVTLTATIYPQTDDTVYIKSVYAPAKVYLNQVLVYEFGKQENYPDFMIDPATEVHMVETNGDGAPMTLKIEFLSPNSRSTLAVQPPIVGTSKEIILERLHVLGIPLVLAITQMVYGVSLLFICVCLLIVDRKGIAFLWLGLFSLVTGAWAFGENNFTGIVFKNSTVLYLISFMGFFTFIIPLLRFARSIIDFEKPMFLWIMELFFTIVSGTAVVLQLLGIVPFSKSMYVFHLMLPVALIILTVYTIIEAILYHNTSAKRFILPIAMLALSALLELFNYKFPFTYVFSSIFQLGIMFFLLIMGVTAGLSVKDSIDLKNRKKELAFEKDLMDIQIKEQESRSLLLSQHEQLLRQQRHDLRHHLNVIQELAWKDNVELQEYLNALNGYIPQSGAVFCENRAVNAIIEHYDTMCKQMGIEFTVNVVVPEGSKKVSDSALCVIFGNLLENAVEACGRMQKGRRFIKIKSALQYDILTITMDNSFNGTVKMEKGRFRSSKRNDFGIGLASVCSVAKEAGGDVDFRSEGQVFLSSVFLNL